MRLLGRTLIQSDCCTIRKGNQGTDSGQTEGWQCEDIARRQPCAEENNTANTLISDFFLDYRIVTK